VDVIQAGNMKKFDDINNALTVEIYQAVKKASKQMTKIVEKSREEQDNKSKGMGKDMINLLNGKANVSDLEVLNRSKANKLDTESLLESLLIVHR
jgi:hypothetical protein